MTRVDAPLRTISTSGQMAVVLDCARDSQRVGYKLSGYLYMYEDVDSYVVRGRRKACHFGRDLCAKIRGKLSPIGQLEAVKNPNDRFQQPSSNGSTAVNRLVHQLLRRTHSFRRRGREP